MQVEIEKLQDDKDAAKVYIISLRELLDDFFSGFLRQFSGGNKISSFNDLVHLRGLVLLCDVYDQDEIELNKINSILTKKWKLFSSKFNESLELLIEIEMKKLEELNSRMNKKRRSREELDWEMSDMFWNFSSTFNNNDEVLQQDSSSRTKNSSNSNNRSVKMISDIRNYLLLQQQQQRQDSPPLPPTIILPGKESCVRSRLGTALSESMEYVVRELRN